MPFPLLEGSPAPQAFSPCSNKASLLEAFPDHLTFVLCTALLPVQYFVCITYHSLISSFLYVLITYLLHLTALQEGRDFVLSITGIQHLEQCLTYNRAPINIC